jgi:hypothetical protein
MRTLSTPAVTPRKVRERVRTGSATVRPAKGDYNQEVAVVFISSWKRVILQRATDCLLPDSSMVEAGQAWHAEARAHHQRGGTFFKTNPDIIRMVCYLS